MRGVYSGHLPPSWGLRSGLDGESGEKRAVGTVRTLRKVAVVAERHHRRCLQTMVSFPLGPLKPPAGA
jgi:hypothetical protein